MSSISLKLSDDILKTSVYCANVLRISRAEFIRRAVDRMNRETMAQIRAKKLARASEKVREESMRVNAEFDAIEEDLEI
jgi:hypothetical protein